MEQSYKEKYEQALEVAKKTYDKQPMYREWLEKMFPELKESEDEKIREALIRFHKSTIDIDGIKGADIISWLEKQGEQKPSDEEMKTLLYTEYEKGRADVIAEIQKEWSEEDEKEYKYVLKFVDNILNNCGNKKDYEHCKRCYDWLKSLRPQNNWKPSDEQMEALNYVVNLMASSESPKENDYYYNVFKDLRKQLKKLKEG